MNHMSHIHTVEDSTIYVIGQDDDEQQFLGCFTHTPGEDPTEVGRRWDVFADKMWQCGLEPMEDEPHFTMQDGGRIFDHYALAAVAPAETEVDA